MSSDSDSAEASKADSTPDDPRDHALQHVLGACYGALALGAVLATVLGVWLDAPGGPVRINDPEKLTSGGCAAPQIDDPPSDYIGVPCDDPDATVLVIDVTDPVDVGAPQCPYGTDFEVEVWSSTLADAVADPEIDSDDLEVAEIACVRNLYPPHPGDPGAGGGQLIADDCFILDGDEEVVVEVPCVDDEEPTPEFEVLEIVGDEEDCPEDETEEVRDRWSDDIKPDEDGYEVVCATPHEPEDAED
ncbi:MAG: hypothetical protein ACRDXX_05815 [Stackebrandtia sp.]